VTIGTNIVYQTLSKFERANHEETPFVPIQLVNRMFEEIPDDFWSNPGKKIVDPSCSTGVFLLEAVRRFNIGLKGVIPEEKQRLRHILTNQIYGAEPSMAPFLVANGMFHRLFVKTGIVDNLNIYHGNVLDDKIVKRRLNMKFDVCIQNPPYQDRISPDRPNSKDIFHHFVEWSHQHSNVTIALTPSRWFFKKSLNSYKEWLISREQGLRSIWHTDDDKVFGNGVSVKGGVCFVVLDKSYTGPTYVSFLNDYIDLTKNNARILNSRSLVAESILAKTTSEVFLSSVYKPTLYYKITTNDSRVISEKSDKSVKIYVNKKRGFEAWIEKELIEHIDTFNTWKVIHRSADGRGNDYTTFSHIAKPGEAVSQSYCHFSFESENECLNYQTYFQTNFYRFLMKCGKKKQHLYSAAFSYIPLVSFDEAWDDEKLAQKFGLTEEEVAYINEQVG
jgi:site-specific DNA-methyltransferase (adenine-specific)